MARSLRPLFRHAGFAPALLVLLLAAPGVHAQAPVPTRIVVRAVSQDAKIIGTSVGGARITIRHAATGAVLASGVQEGGTGDTGLIMGARPRGGGVFDTPGAAGFEATLELSEPTPVTIEAEGPLGSDHAAQRASASLLLVPGHDVVGDGVILTLHGFTVEFLEAPATAAPGDRVAVRVRLTMLCGCPTSPGGLWDADGMTLELALLEDGVPVTSVPLSYTGETSVYAGELQVPASLPVGSAVLRALAVDAGRANAGMVLRELRIGS